MPVHSGRWYESTSRPAAVPFRNLVYSPYDGDYRITFFDPLAGALWEPVVNALDDMGDLRLVAPTLPEQTGPAVRYFMRKLLSPRADVRAEAVHRIADLGEEAIPALTWLKEMAFYDDIDIHDRQQRRTNPSAQAQHALRRLSEITAVAIRLDELPMVVDLWLLRQARPSRGPDCPKSVRIKPRIDSRPGSASWPGLRDSETPVAKSAHTSPKAIPCFSAQTHSRRFTN